MDELTAPQQNRLLAGLSNLLRRVEQDSGPEFLPRGLDVMGLVRQLALPSAETVEKMSYGDPLFRMPTQSNIPITTDRGYLAEVLGLAPAASAASRATTRLSNEAADALVRQITGRSDATAMRALEEIGQMSPVPQVMSGSRDLIRSSADDLAGELNSLGFQAKVQHSGSRAGPSSYVEIYDPQTGRFFTKPIRFSGHGKGPFEAAGVIDVQDPSTDIPNIVQEALQMREMGPSTVFQKQAIADELIAGGMKPKQAYAEAEQRVAGLLEPQAGATKKLTRSEVQAEAKSLGLPATGKTEEIQELISIVKSDPRTWTKEQYTLIRPHLAIHQDFRPGSAERAESIMQEGLRSGMVDYLDPLERGQYSFAKGLVGSDAYLFPTRGLKFKSESDPHLAPGNVPLFRITPEKGQDIYEAIVKTAQRRTVD